MLKRLLAGSLLVLTAACASEHKAEGPPDTVKDYVPTSSTAPPSTTRSSDPCIATVQALDGVEPLPADVDLVARALEGDIAPMPLPGADAAVVVEQRVDETPADYVANATVDDPAKRIEDLEAAGHVVSLSQGLRFGDDSFGIIIHELGSEDQAAAYRGIHLSETCRRADQMRAMTTVRGGASFYRTDVRAPLARSTFVLGPYEVNLDICVCVEVPDRQALAEKWASAIVRDATTT